MSKCPVPTGQITNGAYFMEKQQFASDLNTLIEDARAAGLPAQDVLDTLSERTEILQDTLTEEVEEA